MFSCEYCKIFKNTFFYWTPSVAASVVCKMIYWFLCATNVAFKWVNPFSPGMLWIKNNKKKKQKKKTALNDHISKTWKDLESRLKFLESSSNYLQNSVLFGALYSRCQRLQGLLMSQKKIFKLLLFFPYFFEKWAESLKKNIFFYIWPKAMP